ncbi:DUF6116 family protein [Halorubrum yunnanense]|uniref:DUF6116 family protein n=1 Tax=Halorubrum yunnanense TaxID=1526162 RepID=A0ABD5YH45_9EURY|nr:DUF6116 family protein [Halorubrum yunnanense]
MSSTAKSAGSIGLGATLGVMFLLIGSLFILDLIVPDPVPVLDEIVLLTLTIVSGGGSYKSFQNCCVE